MIPELLRNRIRKRQCVAFVGAGFSMACDMPSWGALLKNLLEDYKNSQSDEAMSGAMDSCRQAIEDFDYSMAANMLRDLMTPSEIDESIRRQFGLHNLHLIDEEKRNRTFERMESLVKVPWAGILTTNFDELIEHAIGKWCKREVVKAAGGDPRLGVILSSSFAGSLFFVKIHGSINASGIVLGTEEYDRVYLGTPQMTTFLSAVMLRYHVLFIGCSFEDELGRIRRKLCHEFGRLIPTSYLLLPGTKQNLARKGWLREYAQVECLFYPEHDELHLSVDRFLKEAALVAETDLDGRTGGLTQNELQRMAICDRLSHIGFVNFKLLRAIFSQPKGRLEHLGVLNWESRGCAISGAADSLLHLSSEERVYRALFLVSIGLLHEERGTDGIHVYCLAEGVREALTTLLELEHDSEIAK